MCKATGDAKHVCPIWGEECPEVSVSSEEDGEIIYTCPHEA